jgi:hypothetical protein
MKLRVLKVEAFAAATETELMDEVNAWLEDSSEATPSRAQSELVAIEFGINADIVVESVAIPFYCFITYTDS